MKAHHPIRELGEFLQLFSHCTMLSKMITLPGGGCTCPLRARTHTRLSRDRLTGRSPPSHQEEPEQHHTASWPGGGASCSEDSDAPTLHVLFLCLVVTVPLPVHWQVRFLLTRTCGPVFYTWWADPQVEGWSRSGSTGGFITPQCLVTTWCRGQGYFLEEMSHSVLSKPLSKLPHADPD